MTDPVKAQRAAVAYDYLRGWLETLEATVRDGEMAEFLDGYVQVTIRSMLMLTEQYVETGDERLFDEDHAGEIGKLAAEWILRNQPS